MLLYLIFKIKITTVRTLILDLEARLYGLIKDDIRSIIFKYCTANDIKTSLSQEKKPVVLGWVIFF